MVGLLPMYWKVEVLGVRLPFFTKTFPEFFRLTVPEPASNVALAVIDRAVSTVVVGLVPPKVVVKVVAASPMVRVPKTNVPAVPAQEAPLEPMQLEPEAEDLIVVVPPADWFKVWDDQTLIEPELVTEVEPTVKALLPMTRLPDLTLSSLVASTATPAVNVPVPLTLRL